MEKETYEINEKELKLKNYGKGFDYFFNTNLIKDKNKLRFTNISIFSSTPYIEAEEITNIITNFFDESSNDLIITDCCSNIGSNSISFLLNEKFKYVNVVEYDELTYNILLNNIDVFDLNYKVKNKYNDDYNKVFKKLDQDVVFIDAEWTIDYYYNKKNNIMQDLYLGKTNIIDLVETLIIEDLATLIVLKVPINYNIFNLINKTTKIDFMINKIFRGNEKKFHSYNIILCYRNI